MKNFKIILFTFILISGTSSLFAQPSNDQEKEQVMEVFEVFFNSMKSRDTISLKTCIHFSFPTRWFFKQFSGNDQQFGGSSSSTVSGFLQTVSSQDGIVGKCLNEFDNIDVQIYQRYAVVTAHYQCIFQGDLNNKGIYTVQMLKSDKWRVECITRFAEKIE